MVKGIHVAIDTIMHSGRVNLVVSSGGVGSRWPIPVLFVSKLQHARHVVPLERSNAGARIAYSGEKEYSSATDDHAFAAAPSIKDGKELDRDTFLGKLKIPVNK